MSNHLHVPMHLISNTIICSTNLLFFFNSRQAVHEEKKSFKCPKWDSSFSIRGNMEAHNALVHEGKKPFKCSFCNAKFSRLGSLDGHVTRFHEKSFHEKKNTFNWSRSDKTKKIVKKSKQKLSKSEKSARIKNIEDQIAHLRRDFDDSNESENDCDNDFDHSLMDNPWQVESMEEFACLKCPECIFTTKEESIFQDHAVENHPLSYVLYGIRIPMQATPTQVMPLQATRMQAMPKPAMPKPAMPKPAMLKQATPSEVMPLRVNPTPTTPRQTTFIRKNGNKQHPCTRCDHTFGNEINLLEHLHSAHFKTKNYFCHICTEIPQGFSVWNDFEKHLIPKRVLLSYFGAQNGESKAFNKESLILMWD